MKSNTVYINKTSYQADMKNMKNTRPNKVQVALLIAHAPTIALKQYKAQTASRILSDASNGVNILAIATTITRLKVINKQHLTI